MWHTTIQGEPASKANSRRIVVRQGSPAVIKSRKALSYASLFRLQARPLKPLLTGDVWVCAHIHYASRRPDLDESLILDLLQGVAYANDRQVKMKFIKHGLDKKLPRTELWIGSMDDDYWISVVQKW